MIIPYTSIVTVQHDNTVTNICPLLFYSDIICFLYPQAIHKRCKKILLILIAFQIFNATEVVLNQFQSVNDHVTFTYNRHKFNLSGNSQGRKFYALLNNIGHRMFRYFGQSVLIFHSIECRKSLYKCVLASSLEKENKSVKRPYYYIFETKV